MSMIQHGERSSHLHNERAKQTLTHPNECCHGASCPQIHHEVAVANPGRPSQFLERLALLGHFERRKIGPEVG